MPEPEYDKSDGWHEGRGTECCPKCGAIYSGNGGYTGPVYDMNGNHYESPFHTDPTDGPFPCEQCWEQIRTRQRVEQNHGLSDFA